MNGLTLLVVLALAIGIVMAWRAGLARGRREATDAARDVLRPPVNAPPPPVVESAQVPTPETAERHDSILDEHARLVRSFEAENATLRARIKEASDDFQREVAAARAEAARYRELVVDIENNAPPPLLDGPNAPDDLKLIVGIGPVLERMLHKMGVTTYRQVARWSEREIDEFDARLPEFPGRIRRDAWVTQARALHQSKFGETLPARGR